jgi:hypothetical protein
MTNQPVDQYGGQIGGPVRIPKIYNRQNKTFFMFATEHSGSDRQYQFGKSGAGKRIACTTTTVRGWGDTPACCGCATSCPDRWWGRW